MCPATLERDISPPPIRKFPGAKRDQACGRYITKRQPSEHHVSEEPTSAAIEAGQAQIDDHLEYFIKKFAIVRRLNSPGALLSFEDWQKLYRRNEHDRGHHFVIHQHDHPIAGVHYDLRLQFSDTSTISFAIPYGLPGNPNSVRPNRMAIETRVHNLWNNLIESASHATGSLLIWDTGEYEVIPRKEPKGKDTDDELSDKSELASLGETNISQAALLSTAFQRRHIRLRLHGTRLPPGYTIALRLPSSDNNGPQPRKPRTKRRRADPIKVAARKASRAKDDTTDDEASPDAGSTDAISVFEDNDDAAVASDGEEEQLEVIRMNNAYPGATNSIGSVHQRHWFVTLDRKNSGCRKGRNGRWEGDWEPFLVRGREVERSIVTGRRADDVMADEGVEKFTGRKMWRPILE